VKKVGKGKRKWGWRWGGGVGDEGGLRKGRGGGEWKGDGEDWRGYGGGGSQKGSGEWFGGREPEGKWRVVWGGGSQVKWPIIISPAIVSVLLAPPPIVYVSVQCH
jgi:hypothetical protein